MVEETEPEEELILKDEDAILDEKSELGDMAMLEEEDGLEEMPIPEEDNRLDETVELEDESELGEAMMLEVGETIGLAEKEPGKEKEGMLETPEVLDLVDTEDEVDEVMVGPTSRLESEVDERDGLLDVITVVEEEIDNTLVELCTGRKELMELIVVPDDIVVVDEDLTSDESANSDDDDNTGAPEVLNVPEDEMDIDELLEKEDEMPRDEIEMGVEEGGSVEEIVTAKDEEDDKDAAEVEDDIADGDE